MAAEGTGSRAVRASRRGVIAAALAGAAAGRLGVGRVAAQEAAAGTMFRGVAGKTGEMPGPDVAASPVVRWRFDAPAGEWLAPAVSGGRVFASRYTGGLAAFDAATGQPLWNVPAREIDRFDSSPAVAGGVVVSGAGPYTLLAADAATGTERWRCDVSGAGLADGSGPGWFLYAPICSSPTVAGDAVCVGVWNPSGDGSIGEASENGILAVGLADGAVRWHVRVPAGAISSPAVADGVAHVLDRRANAMAIDVASGVVRWTTPLGGIASSSPAVAQGLVWAAVRGETDPEDGAIVALDTASGLPLWRRKLANPSSPALAGDTLVVGLRDGTVRAFDAVTGLDRWSFDAGGSVAAPTFVPGGLVYLATDAGDVIALDPAAGAERWRFRGEGPFLSSPTVVGGTAYIGTETGTLYALEAAPDGGA